MTLACSIAHMFLYRWFVQSDRTHSSHVSDSRHVTEWSQIHLQKVQQPVLVVWQIVQTSTTVSSRLQTFSDRKNKKKAILQLEGELRFPLFLFINIIEVLYGKNKFSTNKYKSSTTYKISIDIHKNAKFDILLSNIQSSRIINVRNCSQYTICRSLCSR